ncbi:hypothetical protein GGF48_006381, partial [Coemansia sp. RSA 921]
PLGRKNWLGLEPRCAGLVQCRDSFADPVVAVAVVAVDCRRARVAVGSDAGADSSIASAAAVAGAVGAAVAGAGAVNTSAVEAAGVGVVAAVAVANVAGAGAVNASAVEAAAVVTAVVAGAAAVDVAALEDALCDGLDCGSGYAAAVVSVAVA